MVSSSGRKGGDESTLEFPPESGAEFGARCLALMIIVAIEKKWTANQSLLPVMIISDAT